MGKRNERSDFCSDIASVRIFVWLRPPPPPPPKKKKKKKKKKKAASRQLRFIFVEMTKQLTLYVTESFKKFN